ncbi:BamA/TamA family outer membrane protein [Chitinophaga pendula]|uniref:BamA/TamA family outer membrane protein n=1 Tax=Chitinophaga TaxID=79328 RepID=UPI000BAE8204|nr:MULTISPECIES: BamA/TamA family outer membrane protein [Chitinophaga]ASZ10956.1 hypothetical protein CK934_08195 [Chitinophaga sp. MD30]UCJ06055.1 BamA/TamA family outer membrane protein [Chitinophaga pendula]
MFIIRKAILLAFLSWGWQTVTAQSNTDSVVQRIILIGDAGELHHDGKNPVIDAVRNRYNLQEDKNTVLFLGDNVYPLGLPDASARSFPHAKEILDYQANLVRDTKAQAYFIPGNHDWLKSKPGGWQTIRQQQRYLDSLNLPNVRMLPQDGCPGPEEIAVGKNITVVIMDTEWWLFPYEKPGLTSSCDCKTKEDVLAALSDIVIRNQDKILIFAAHHPLRSYGIHGGYYTFKQHIFPLTDLKPSLYIPLPVIGSIYPLARGVFGTPEDLPHPLYQQMIKGIEEAFKPHGPMVYVSGHDHSLQFIRDGQNAYVISGSGAKDTRVKKGRKSQFASKENGYAALELLQDGTLRVQYYLAQQDTPAFTSRLLSLQDIRKQVAASITPAKTLPPVIHMPIDPQYEKVGRFHRFLLGNNYRNVWATPMNFPVIDLQKEKGGLKILKRGGGKQTRSLRLEDSTGREWVLRSLKKYPDEAVPEELRETIAKDVVQDQISAANPYAPLPIPILADAVGVPHANPTMVFLPADTSLGIYRQSFGNDVYLFEEREPVTSKTYNTEKVLDQINGDNDNTVHQKAVLRARLLDIFIADWDRHEDQWRWYADKHKKQKEFYPIPRDRDQAFFVNEGFISRQASRPWLLPKFQGFREKIPYIQGYNFNARHFDRSFLNELDEKQWQTDVRQFLTAISDSVLQTAVNRFPDTIRHLVGERTLRVLKARRDILEREAMKYYRFLSREVDVTGTEKNELFNIERLPEGKLAVNVYKISKKGETEQRIYSRTFDPAVTKEIRFYGLGGEDRFQLSGTHPSPLRIRLIGGKDADTYTETGNAHGGKRVHIYDLKNGKDSFLLNGARERLSSNPGVIQYNRRAFKYNKTMPLITAGFNRDDGILLGLGVQHIGQGFRKEPFAVKHTFTASHALATRAFQFRYQGEFTDVFGKTDVLLFASARAPHNTINFFGQGNETVFDKSNGKNISYYRARYNLFNVEALLKSKLATHISLAYGPTFNYYALDKDENQGRFVTNFKTNGLDSLTVFRDKYYAGLRLALQVDTRNSQVLPSRGVFWTTSLLGNQGLNEEKRNYMQLQTDLSFFTSFRIPASVVIISRFGGGVQWGNPEYFQGMMLGGIQHLRGYRNYRFNGTSMVYNNMEARIKLLKFKSYLFPATVGLIAFNDVGRVWQKGETSHEWHDGYGGGLYFVPLDMFMITAVVGHSKEETLPYITLGWRF